MVKSRHEKINQVAMLRKRECDVWKAAKDPLDLTDWITCREKRLSLTIALFRVAFWLDRRFLATTPNVTLRLLAPIPGNALVTIGEKILDPRDKVIATVYASVPDWSD